MNNFNLGKGWVFFLAIFLLAGCNSFPKEMPTPQTGTSKIPEIIVDPETGMHSVVISVLNYNVAGLPWPIRKKRKNQIRIIGYLLGEMRAVNAEPDIVLLEEAFTMKSNPIPDFGGYPNVVGGPKRNHKAEKLPRELNPEFYDERSFWKGEKVGKLVNSGLAILSNFPILEKQVHPYRRGACAGFDCIANKGMVVAIIQIPGVPEPIAVFNTHMQAIDASGVSLERSRTAHNLQADEMVEFLTSDLMARGIPLIVAGDFNTKHDEGLMRYISNNENPIHTVRYYCTQVVDDCKIRMSFDSDAPWMDTQDLQAFFSGSRVTIRPIAIEAIFDRPVEGKTLSDHDGYFVEYRLSWDPADFGD